MSHNLLSLSHSDGAIVAGVILLLEVKSPKIEASKRLYMAIGGLILVSLFFSLLLSVFRSKYSGYPYSFLIK
jgi:hypothetical protein